MPDQDPALAVAPEAPPAAPEGVEQPAVDPNEGFTRVPTDQLGEWGGRYGDALREAHQYRQVKDNGLLEDGVSEVLDLFKQHGMTARQGLDFITSSQDAAPGITPRDSQAPGLTLESVEDAIERKLTSFEDKAATKAEQQVLNAQHGAEQTFVADTLRTLKFDIQDDGQAGDEIAEFAKDMFNKALNEEIRKSIPDWLPEAEKAKRLKEISETPTTPAMQQAAKARFTKVYADLQNKSVSDFSQIQEGVPDGTLDTGAGGVSEKPTGDMTEKEKAEWTARRVYAKRGTDITGGTLSGD